MNVSPRLVTYAAKVLDRGCPELIAALESGGLKASLAAVFADLPRERQIEEVSCGPQRATARARKRVAQAESERQRRRRFQQEAETASSLNHPHIVTVFEAGTADGQQYLVTEFVDGGTLGDWVRREQPTTRQIVEVLTGIADALATAHQASILHRDIKPGNVLMSKSGYAKLADFGLAKVLEPHSEDGSTLTAGLTRPGIILGTPAYLAPEQVEGKPADPRSDVFSFGVMLYELLAGRRPFAGPSDLVLLQAILHATPQPIGELRPDLPAELRVAVEKALEKDPADRYQTMREMVVDLKRALRAKAAEQAPVSRRARRPIAWLAAGAATLSVLALVAALWTRQGADSWVSPLANADFTRLTDWEGDELDAAISPDGRLAAFLSNRDGIFDAWVSQIGSGTFVNLTKGQFPALVHEGMRSVGFSGDGAYVWLRVADPSSPGPQATGGVWIVPAMAGGAPRPFLSAAGNVAWSPDGARIAYQDSAPGDPIYIADRNGSNPRLLFDDKPAGHQHFPTWSPDARFIYFQRGPATTNRQDIWRIPAAGGQPERVTHHDARVKYPTLLDGRTLVYTAIAADGSGPWLYTTDVETRVARRISQGVERYTSFSASADGRRLAATVSNPSAGLWTVPLAGSAQPESAAARFPLPTVSAGSPRYGPGYLLYLSSTSGAEGLWKFQGNAASELWSGSNGAVAAAPAVSADGKRLCVPILKQGRGVLHLMTAEGTDARTIAESLDVRQAPSWSPDGNWIAVAASAAGGPQGSRIFLVPINGEPPVRVTETLSHTPVWSPDGRMIVYGKQRQGGAAQLAAVTADKKEVPLPEVFVSIIGDRFRFLPDGSGLVVMQGEFRRLNFWHLDLKSGQRRQITALKPGPLLRSFDISPDGKQIVFDRIQENTDVVLIDRKR